MKFNIPIEILQLDEESYHLVVKAIVNSTPCNLILDTGASRSVFDINTFRVRFSDEETGKEIIPAGIIEGTIENRFGIIDRFCIGDFEEENMRAVFIDLDHINKLYKKIEGTPVIAGLLGSDFLVRQRAIIDFKKSLLILVK